MNLINYNPYRILDLPITASEREIAKQINTLSTFAAIGKEKSYDSDFPFLMPVARTTQTIDEAKKQIEQNENKFQYSLFWFWDNNIEDKLAITQLSKGNTYGAISFWERYLFNNKKNDYLSIVEIENLLTKQSVGWIQEVNDDHILEINENKYFVERLKVTGSSIPSVFVDLNFDGNWAIECETEWFSGVENNAYGIILGRENGNYYSFQISANGYYCFNKVIEWNSNSLIPWKHSIWIKNKSKNRIQIKKIENILCFFVNDYFLGTWNADYFYGKHFGFKVNGIQKISFENFKFCKLSAKEIYAERLDLSSENLSWTKNLSILYLSLAMNERVFQLDHFNKGIALAKSIFNNEYIEEYSKIIAGKQYVYNKEKTLHFYLSEILDSLKNHIEQPEGLSIKQLFESFSAFPDEAKQFLSKKFVSKQIQNIDKEIKLSQLERKNLAANEAANIGNKLVKNTKTDILYLKDVLGEKDFQYPIIADKLAIEIEQCGIVFLNDTNDDVIFLPEYEFALSIVVTQRAKKRVQEILESCKKRERTKLYGDIFQRINLEIKTSQDARKSSPITSCPTGIELVKNTKRDIDFLKNALGVKDFEYQSIADRLAIAIFECGIDFFNASGNDDIFQPEYEYALSISVSNNVKHKIKDSLDSCVERWNLKITEKEKERQKQEEKQNQQQREKQAREKARQFSEKNIPKCWFCGYNLSGESTKFTASVYKESFFKRVGDSSNQNYKVAVNIPRCKSCKEKHEEILHKFSYSLIGFSLISTIVGVIINENTYEVDWFSENWYFCLIIGLIVGFTIGILWIRQGNKNSKIKRTQNSSIENYPELKEKLKQGWKFSKISKLISDLLK